MKRHFFLLFLVTLSVFISNAKEKNPEIVLGTYWNSFSNQSLQVSAIVDSDNKLKLFLEIPIFIKNVERMKLEIKEENIPLLHSELLKTKDKRWELYTKFKEDGRNYYITDMNGITFPIMRVHWLVGGKWHTSKKFECVPTFEISNGRYIVYVDPLIEEKITGKDIAIGAGFIALAAIAVVMSENSEEDILGINDPTQYMSSSYEDTYDFQLRWGFSTQKDISAVINWLDIDLLKKKYNSLNM